jgi:Tol biopolymer transport system component
MKIKAFIIVFFITFSYFDLPQLLAQNTLERFGKNRIQYKKFDWKYISTPNFEIYFYDYGVRISQFAARFLEKDFNEITDLLGFQPTKRSRIFLYNSISDLQQSNMGVHDDGIVVGGLTDFFKAQVEVAFTGNENEFKKELRRGLAFMLVREMMFGANLKDMIQNSYLGKFSEWFLFGIADYAAEGWSDEVDDYVRDMVRKDKWRKPHLATGKEAIILGQSIWNFVAEKYGKNNISSILNASRITRNERTGIGYALGIDYGNFIDEWKKFYTIPTQELLKNLTDAPSSFKLAGKNRKNRIYNEFKISPDGKYIAYSENKGGKYKVYVQDLVSRKRKVIFKGGYNAVNQRFDENIPLLSWKDNTNLGIIYEKKSKILLSVYNIYPKNYFIFKKYNRTYYRQWEYFNHVKGFDFSDDGQWIVFSADRKQEVDIKTGQNDLFVFNIKENNLKAITDDFYDDLHPVFMPNSTVSIAFSSNRLSDSLKTVTRITKGNFDKDVSNFNIFIYRPKVSKDVLQRVTNSIGINTLPRFLDNKNIVYISDETGIAQLKKYNLDTEKNIQLTNFTQSVRAFDVNSNQKGLAYLMLNKRNLYPNYINEFDFNTQIPQTFFSERANLRLQRNPTAKIENIKPVEVSKDSTENKKPINSDYANDEIDTDNYTFDEDIVKKQQDVIEKKQNELIELAKKGNQTDIKIKGSYDYSPRARFENVLTTLQIDPLRGWGLLVNMSTADLLENHKIRGGFLYILNDLRSSDFFGEHQYLARRLDISTRFDRRTIFINKDDPFVVQRYNSNRIQTSVSYSVSNLLRVSVAPFYMNTLFTSLDSPFAKQHRIHYAGVRAEAVYDNSIVTGQNMIYGTRAKFVFENYHTVATNEGFRTQTMLTAKNMHFFKMSADVRHYIRIHKDIVLAMRGVYGRFGGNNPKNFLLGGMDNWLFNDRDNGGRVQNPLGVAANIDNSDLLFVEFVTNMRGYNYNKMAGENVLLGNFELRLPIFKYLFGNRIKSSFFSNLQLVGFYDIGTAWTGISPFERQNSLNTRIINTTPFNAVVNDFKNPWLQGYGAGLRTIIFGYYTKFDVALPIEDFISAPEPKYYFTIGYDF